MSTREEKQKVVCVSGGAGYIASWVVKLLLQRGYTVKATMRDPNDPKKTEHLLALEGAKERLQLFKADLLEEGSFDSVVNGCIGVFHTASPVLLSVADPQAELIDPALKGTLNVLRSCAKVSSIKRVGVTSSIAMVSYIAKPLTSGDLVDETWFSDPDFREKSKLWYVLSKILAEKAAWESAKENEIDLVTINPGIVIGPLLQPTVNLRVENLYPTLHLPDKCEDDKPFAPKYEYSREKAEALGVEFTPLEISLRDTIESLREKGFISV